MQLLIGVTMRMDINLDWLFLLELKTKIELVTLDS